MNFLHHISFIIYETYTVYYFKTSTISVPVNSLGKRTLGVYTFFSVFLSNIYSFCGNLLNNHSLSHSCSLSDYERFVIILLRLSAKDYIRRINNLKWKISKRLLCCDFLSVPGSICDIKFCVILGEWHLLYLLTSRAFYDPT